MVFNTTFNINQFLLVQDVAVLQCFMVFNTTFNINQFLLVQDVAVLQCFMVFNTTFNNILAILWLSVSLEDLDKTTDLLQVTDKLDHIMLYTSP